MTPASAVICFLLSLVVVGCGGTATKPLVLDRSIGVVTLKESRARIERDIGKGTVISSKLDHSARPEPLREEQVAYKSAGLVVWYISNTHQGPIGIVVETTSARYRTSGGVGVGTSLEDLRKGAAVECYGPDCQHFHGHNKPGTSFRLTRPGGRVAQIVIQAYVD